MPCMRQMIGWLLAGVFKSLPSYRVVSLKATGTQVSETEAMKFRKNNGLVYLAIYVVFVLQ